MTENLSGVLRGLLSGFHQQEHIRVPEPRQPFSRKQACSLFEWLHIDRGKVNDGTVPWTQVEKNFRDDPLIAQMNTWEKGFLSEEEFWSLVVYQGPETEDLYRRQTSRLLKDVARELQRIGVAGSAYSRSISLNHRNKPNALSAEFFTPVFLRETIGDSERADGGSLYIHEGNHRLLAYAKYLLDTGERYTPIPVVIGRKTQEGITEKQNTLPKKEPLAIKGFKERSPITQAEVLRTFQNAEQIYFILPEKIGDTVMASGFIKSICEFERMTKLPTKEKIIMAPLSMHQLLRPFCEALGLKLMQAPEASGVNRAEYQAREVYAKKAMVFELIGYSGGNPEGYFFGNGRLTIKNMLPSFIERYGVREAGCNRQKNYLADLFGADTSAIDPRRCQPGLEIRQNDRLLAELLRKYNIDTKPQVSINIEASEPGRQYSIENWCEVAKMIKSFYPEAEFNIIFDPGKKPEDETYLDREIVKQEFTKALSIGRQSVIRLIGEPLNNVVQLMRSQSVVLSNDTGLPHLVATTFLDDMPDVVVLFTAPHANPDHWMSSPIMKPLVPPDDIATLIKGGGIYCVDKKNKWINKINPAKVVGAALASWKS